MNTGKIRNRHHPSYAAGVAFDVPAFDGALDFCNRAETGKTRCAQTVPRLVSARLQKSKGKSPSRARLSYADFLWQDKEK
ncbi:hypothetical protein CXP34_11845 [Ralstonia mannitolilytica]|nr:hypothetical protein CXP34_11845 [Ralstonia mannitolilytica]